MVIGFILLDCFNPRPHTAGDTEEMLVLVSEKKFQSTPAHGGRRRENVY